MSSHVSAHGRGAVVATTEPGNFWNIAGIRISATDLASSVEWAYETAIVGGICENVGKFSTLVQLVHTSGAVYLN